MTKRPTQNRCLASVEGERVVLSFTRAQADPAALSWWSLLSRGELFDAQKGPRGGFSSACPDLRPSALGSVLPARWAEWAKRPVRLLAAPSQTIDGRAGVGVPFLNTAARSGCGERREQ